SSGSRWRRACSLRLKADTSTSRAERSRASQTAQSTVSRAAGLRALVSSGRHRLRSTPTRMLWKRRTAVSHIGAGPVAIKADDALGRQEKTGASREFARCARLCDALSDAVDAWRTWFPSV